jgi:hypothetical protein
MLLAGLVSFGAAFLLLRSFGPRFRIGRLLASAPQVTVAEARALAERGDRKYVQVRGRIDAEEEFEDADHRPLVFRRTRLEANVDGRWTPFEDDRRSVPFEVREGAASIRIDDAKLSDGLVVVPRVSEGTAADLDDRAPEGLSPATQVRVTIEQLSSVEHAVVVGLPVVVDGEIRLTAGLDRPLILTTLERAEAMRLLGGGGRAKARVVAALMGIGLAFVVSGLALALALFLAPPAVAAATPGPSGVLGGDPRSSGEGPGLVGEPLLAIGAVLAIGILAALLTTIYVRATRRPERP